MKRVGQSSQSVLGVSCIPTECFRYCKRFKGCSVSSLDHFKGFSFQVKELWQAQIVAKSLSDELFVEKSPEELVKESAESPQSRFERAGNTSERVLIVAEQLINSVSRYKIRNEIINGTKYLGISISILDGADLDSLLADNVYETYLALYIPTIVSAAGEDKLPLDDVVSACMQFNTAPAIISGLVKYDTSLMQHIVHLLLRHQPISHLPHICDQHEAVIAAIAATSHESAVFVKDVLLHDMVYPSTLLEVVLLMSDSDLSQFILQLTVNPNASAWFKEALIHSGENGSRNSIDSLDKEQKLSASGRAKKCYVDHRIRERLLAAVLSEKDMIDTESLQALVALHCSGLQQEASSEEISKLFDRICHHLQPRAVLLFVVLMLCCPKLIPSFLPQESVTSFFKACLTDADLKGYFLLFCSIAVTHQNLKQQFNQKQEQQQQQDEYQSYQHLEDNQLQLLANMVTDIAGFPVHLSPASAQKLFDVVRREVLPEKRCCELASSLPLVTNETPEVTAMLTLLTIYMLLLTNLFTRFSVDISEWVTKQLLATSFPIPPLLPAIIKLFLHSIGQSSRMMKQDQDSKICLLTEAAIRSVLGLKPAAVCRSKALISIPITGSGSSRNQRQVDRKSLDPDEMTDSDSYGDAADVLSLYYILLTNEITASSRENSILRPYPVDLLWELPVHSLLAKLRAAGDSCNGGLESSLKKLVLMQIPFCCGDDKELHNEMKSDLNSVLMQLRQLILRLPHVDVGQYVSLTSMWHDLYRSDPWTVSMATSKIICLSPPGSRNPTPEPHDLVADPLAVFCVVNPHILRIPSLMTIVLEILECVIRANHKALQEANAVRLKTLPPDDGLAMLPLVQDSAIVQTLLELIEPVHKTLPPFSNQLALRGVRTRVCSFLHQMFLADPLLIKLVHFQGYDPELIPVLVRNVPSLHVCLDWLPELLVQPDHHKQLFAIRLTASLVEHHRIPKSLAAAQHVLSRLQNYTFGTLDAPQFLCTALPSLVPICRSFPFLKCASEQLVSSIEKLMSGGADGADAALLDAVVKTKALLDVIQDNEPAY